MRSPDLRVELTTDWRVIAGLVLWIGVCVAALWRADLPPAAAVLLTLALLAVGVPVLASQLFGLDPGLPVGLAWSSEGGWHVRHLDGSHEALQLSPASRVFRAGALLVFRRRRSVSWVLLLARPGGSPALRRLRVRLNLDRSRRSAWLYNPPAKELSRSVPVSRGARAGPGTGVASPDGH